jgi:hypothetical protein
MNSLISGNDKSEYLRLKIKNHSAKNACYKKNGELYIPLKYTMENIGYGLQYTSEGITFVDPIVKPYTGEHKEYVTDAEK